MAVGFKHEGRQAEAVWKEGKWVDVLWMGILAREYYAGKADASRNTRSAEAGDHPNSSTRTSNALRMPQDWVLL